MQSFSELTAREKAIEIARWVGVLPTAVLVDVLVSVVVGTGVRMASEGGLGILGGSTFAVGLRLILGYVLPKAAFVVAGTKLAPRGQVACALALGALGLGLSLLKHILGQHQVGNQVGMINYLHLLAEVGGLLAGAAVIVCQNAVERRNMPGKQ